MSVSISAAIGLSTRVAVAARLVRQLRLIRRMTPKRIVRAVSKLLTSSPGVRRWLGY